MKKIITYLFVLLISNMYAQCDDYNQSQCSNDNNCEWIENIETEWCSGNNQAECFAQEECYWYPGGIYLGSQCTGGSYEVDNSYCQENEMPGCSDMNESECSSDDVCEWIEDIETGNCSVFDNSESSCTSYSGECYWDEDITYTSCDYPNSGICNSYEGCYWDCFYGYCDCNGQQQIVDTECVGQYEIDNSYCQEIEMPECSEMSETECNSINDCEWTENIVLESCNNINSQQECNAVGCSWYNGNYYACSICCWGEYEVDDSYCEETEYELGDINQDSIINIQDVIIVINLILNGEFDLGADLNLDNTVNVLDVIQLVNIILNN